MCALHHEKIIIHLGWLTFSQNSRNFQKQTHPHQAYNSKYVAKTSTKEEVRWRLGNIMMSRRAEGAAESYLCINENYDSFLCLDLLTSATIILCLTAHPESDLSSQMNQSKTGFKVNESPMLFNFKTPLISPPCSTTSLTIQWDPKQGQQRREVKGQDARSCS